MPDELLWQVQQQALDAKIALSSDPKAHLRLDVQPEPLELTLDREGAAGFAFGRSAAAAPTFAFENRAQDLLARCRTILQMVLEEAGLGWNDIEEIVLAGGSSRMPMIRKMLAKEAGRPLTLAREGFDYDTAISIGAALYATRQSIVTDVVAHSIGIELLNDSGRPYVEPLLKKNTPLPQAVFEDSFDADANATLKVYEGESERVADYPRGPLGTLQLGNPAGPVAVRLSQDAGGLIVASVTYEGKTQSKNIEPHGTTLNLDELTARVQRVTLELP